MRVELLTSPNNFLRQTEPLRAADPYRTNILGSVATAVASGSLIYDDYLWWVVIDNDNQIVGAAMRTAPHGMVLSPMSVDAVGELAKAVSKRDDQLPSVSGPTDTVVAFMDRYKTTRSSGSLRTSKIEENLLLYTLHELTIPTVDGAVTTATPVDYPLIVDWYVEFGNETGVFMPNPAGSVHAGLERNSFRFWVVNGEKVSLAGHAPLVDTPSGNVGRVGPVYTPPTHRRKGYAGALTAKLTEELLNIGAKVMLYTDASNPTSNSIYQKIGYELLGESVMFTFSMENV